MTKKLANAITNKTANMLANLGVDMAGEGMEEILSGVVSAVGQKLTYASDAQLSELFSKEEALESFIGGAILGGFGSVTGNNTQTTQQTPTQTTPQVSTPVLDSVKQNTAPGGVTQFNIDNAKQNSYTETNKGGALNVGAGQLLGTSSEGVRAGRSGDGSGATVENGTGVLGREDLSNSGIVLLSPKAKDTLAQRGVVIAEVQDTSGNNAAFSSALETARNADTQNGWAVTPKTVDDLSSPGMRTFMADNGSVGFAIAEDGDIEAVFANKTAGAPKGATKSMIPQAIANGGTKLDCYGEALVKIYAQHGFIPVARVTFDPSQANDGWTPDKGTPDIYFMMHNGDSADTVTKNFNKYKKWSKAELDALPLMEYMDAYNYRDNLMNGQNATEDLDGGIAMDAGTTDQLVELLNEDGTTRTGTVQSDAFGRLVDQSDTFHPEGEKAARDVLVPTKDFDGRNIPKGGMSCKRKKIQCLLRGKPVTGPYRSYSSHRLSRWS